MAELVTPEWIKSQQNRDQILVFEVGWNEEPRYAHEHLPGAIYFDTGSLERSPTWNILPPVELEQALLANGITARKTVVLYGDNRLAVARTALALRYAGVEDVGWLVGGKKAWKAWGFALEAGNNNATVEAVFGATIPLRPNTIIDFEQVQSLLEDPSAAVVDVRTWDEHRGQVSGYDYIPTKGCIPGSVWVGEAPDIQLWAGVDWRAQVLQSIREVTNGWQEKGITPEKRITFYCGTGWRASLAFWYADMMGWEQISVYDGGWLEWSQRAGN